MLVLVEGRENRLTLMCWPESERGIPGNRGEIHRDRRVVAFLPETDKGENMVHFCLCASFPH